MENGPFWKFSYVLPKKPDGEPSDLSPEEIEQELIKKVNGDPVKPVQALWNLVQFYKLTAQRDRAVASLRELLAVVPDLEAKAQCAFSMGQSDDGDLAPTLKSFAGMVVVAPKPKWCYVIGQAVKPLRR